MILVTEQTSYTPTTFGYDLIRDHVLASILGKHEEDILYWAGKELARKFPVFELEELPTFFKEAGWGDLTLHKLAKKEAIYHLHIDPNVAEAKHRAFQLEAGFIAEQYQSIQHYLTECYPQIRSKEHLVELTIAWDPKEIIETKS